MNRKRNSFCVGACLFFLGLIFGSGFGGNGRAYADPAVSVSVSGDITKTVESFLKYIRARDKDAAFAQFTPAAREKWGGTSKVFMNTVRLDHAGLYDHVGYHWVNPPVAVSAQAGSLTDQVVRLQLVDVDGRETFVLVRLTQGTDGVWYVNGLTSFMDEDGREA